MKIALFYGTCTGKTEAVAEQIRDELGEDFFEVYEDVSQIEPADLENYDVLFCGIPTWDVGELQYDWQDIYDRLDEVDLTGKKILFFGTGDQAGYPDTYQDAIGIVYLKMLERGAVGKLGFTDTDTHEFEASKGVIDGRFCGLCLDDDCQPELTEQRVVDWCEQVRSELGVNAAS
ncbi:flavodoxin [Phycisphaeraceae bacterium D3-23]